MTGVTAIIPNRDRRELLLRALAALAGQTRPPAEVLVVDNGSSDGSADAAAAAGARVIEMGRNAGFAEAVNRGIQASRTDVLAVINNDVEPEPDWLEHLLRALDAPGTWFATGKMLSAARRGRIDGTFDVLSRGACAWRAGHGRRDGPDWDSPRTIRFTPFTAAVFRAELFSAVGFLDERFESYLEDVDFCLRCALAGYQGVYEPRASARHVGSATLGPWNHETVRRIARNQLLLVAKHYPAECRRRYAWPVLVGQFLWGLVAVRHGAALPFLKGKAEGVRLLRGLPVAAGDPSRLMAILEESEQEILDLQRRTGFDKYWRLYFALS